MKSIRKSPKWSRIWAEMERAEAKQLAYFFKQPKDLHTYAKIKR